MRTVSVRSADLPKVTIPIGYVGENLYTKVIIDCKKDFDEHPDAVVGMTVEPPEGDAYPAIVTRDGDFVVWDVSASDLVYRGSGSIQISFTIDGTIVGKTPVGRIMVNKSIVPDGEVPTALDDFLTRASTILNEIPDDIDDALEEAKASGEFDGPPGEDGVSPTVTIQDITGGHRITITDAEGPHSFDVMDGQGGGAAIDDESTAADKVWSAQKVNGVKNTAEGKYSKPSDGIPSSDMAETVRTSLGKADTAYQKPVSGIPGTDLAAGVIPDPTSIIDDTSEAENKVWSAEKSTSLLSAIQQERNRFEYELNSRNENKNYVQKEFSLDPNDYTSLSKCTVEASGTSLQINRGSYPDTSAGKVYMDISENPADLSQSIIGVDFDIIAGTSGETDYFEEISELNLILKSDSSVSDVRYPLVVNSANRLLYAGNYKMSIHLDVQRNGASVAVDLSAVKKIGFMISVVPHTSGGETTYPGTPKVKINKLFAYSFNKRKQVVVGFDGAYATQMDAAQYLYDLGLPGTFFVNRVLVDTQDPSRMTSANLKTLRTQNHLIANYCSENGYWYNLTLSEKKAAIATNAQWLYAKGYGDGADCVSVPGGGYANDEASIYTEGYAKVITGRSLPNGSSQPSGFYDSQPYGHTNGPSVNSTARKATIDSLIRNGGVCIHIFHACNGSHDDVTLADFKLFADYLKEKVDAGLIEVVTCDKVKTDYTLSYPKASPSTPCTGITLDESSATITGIGTTKTLTATVSPDGCTDTVEWASSNTDVATISDGIVTAVGVGSATITVTCGSYSATCTVTVKAYMDLSNFVTGANVTASTNSLSGGGNGIGGLTTNGGSSRLSVASESGTLKLAGASVDCYPIQIPKNAKSIRISNTSSGVLKIERIGFFDSTKYPMSGYETVATFVDGSSPGSTASEYNFNIPTYTGNFAIDSMTICFRNLSTDIQASDMSYITVEFSADEVT